MIEWLSLGIAIVALIKNSQPATVAVPSVPPPPQVHPKPILGDLPVPIWEVNQGIVGPGLMPTGIIPQATVQTTLGPVTLHQADSTPAGAFVDLSRAISRTNIPLVMGLRRDMEV